MVRLGFRFSVCQGARWISCPAEARHTELPSAGRGLVPLVTRVGRVPLYAGN